MSGTVAERKRLIRVTAGNLRNSHIYIRGHWDFFPPDCFGDASLVNGRPGRPIAIRLEGMRRCVETDIAADARTGRPWPEFRARTWVREFFERHKIQPGDVLALERIGEREFRLRPALISGDEKTDRS